STFTGRQAVAPTAGPGAVDMKLEVVVLPVSDVERAKGFYGGLGWRLDADFSAGDVRVVQFTPPGSACSIHIGRGVTSARPGSVHGLMLVVDDVDAARIQLLGAGADVSEVFHFAGVYNVSGNETYLDGPAPGRASYGSWLSFSDPDGNRWMVQEVRTRRPGRGESSFDVPTLTDLLKETENRHGDYEPRAPKHHWSGWYAAYMVARSRGIEPDEAALQAARHIEGAA